MYVAHLTGGENRNSGFKFPVLKERRMLVAATIFESMA